MACLKPCNLHLLLNEDVFVQDLIIRHSASDETWKLPSDTLKGLYPSLDIKKMVELLVSLPATSITSFIGHLFQKRIERLQDWPHVIWLWSMLGLEDANSPVFVLNQLLPSYPKAEAVDLLFSAWNDKRIQWNKDDAFIAILTYHVKQNAFDTFTESVASQPSRQNELLAIHVTSCLETGTRVEPKFQPIGLISAPITQPEPNAPHTLTGPNDFLFQLHPSQDTHDPPTAVKGDMRYLYSRWTWFANLINRGGVEKKDRIVVMPIWMSCGALMALLRCVHEDRFDEIKTEDATALWEHRLELTIRMRSAPAKLEGRRSQGLTAVVYEVWYSTFASPDPQSEYTVDPFVLLCEACSPPRFPWDAELSSNFYLDLQADTTRRLLEASVLESVLQAVEDTQRQILQNV